eukprot:TRINITY_DN1083_c0_g1_i1.p2 TRINITY_DN1083_c0_g1~~TRINITY_DN1083_c0_g1_i1.p2  ORF type:complete len:141 (+),score=72.80 TRINITY_DN1083_c0_g1_i1:61-483(+)
MCGSHVSVASPDATSRGVLIVEGSQDVKVSSLGGAVLLAGPGSASGKSCDVRIEHVRDAKTDAVNLVIKQVGDECEKAPELDVIVAGNLTVRGNINVEGVLKVGDKVLAGSSKAAEEAKPGEEKEAEKPDLAEPSKPTEP